MHNPFLRALPIVAKALSENYGVSLEIHGNQAKTDGNRIVLPVLPEDDRQAAVLARGYLDHEAGHVKHTDFTLPRGSGLEGALANILEDIRVEQAMSQRYPGCRENLDALVRLLVAEGDFKPVQPSDPPAKIVQGLVLYLLRSRVLGQQALAPLATQARAVFDGKFPGLRSWVESLALAVKDAPDTRTVFDLARRIAALFQDAAQPQAPAPHPQGGGQGDGAPGPTKTGESCLGDTGPQEQRDNQDNGAANDQAGRDDREDDADSAGGGESAQAGDGLDGDPSAGRQPGDDIQDQGQPEAQPGAQRSSAGAGQSGGQPDPGGAEPDHASTPGGLAAAAAEALADGTSYLDLGQAVADKLGEISQQTHDGQGLALEVQPWWQGRPLTEEQLMQATARLRAMLAGVVQAKRARKERPSRFGTRLNLRGLPNLSVKDGRVFLARQERTGVNTAVYLLMDQSGSMAGEKLKVAFMATAALARSLQAIPGAAVAVGTFASTRRDGEVRPYVAGLLEFAAPASRLNQAVPPPTRNTPLAEAMYCVAAKLLRRQEPRKMLVVMTDGDPDDRPATLKAIEKCRGAGIEVYAVGIMHRYVMPLFGEDCAIVVSDITELPGKLFGLLARRL